MVGSLRKEFYDCELVPRILAEASRRPPTGNQSFYIAIVLTSSLFERPPALRDTLFRLIDGSPEKLAELQLLSQARVNDPSAPEDRTLVNKGLNHLDRNIAAVESYLDARARFGKAEEREALDAARMTRAFIRNVAAIDDTDDYLRGRYRANPYVAVRAAVETLNYFENAMRKDHGGQLTANTAYCPLHDLGSLVQAVRQVGNLDKPLSQALPEQTHNICKSLTALEHSLRGLLFDQRISTAPMLPAPVTLAAETVLSFLEPYGAVPPEAPRADGATAQLFSFPKDPGPGRTLVLA